MNQIPTTTATDRLITALESGKAGSATQRTAAQMLRGKGAVVPEVTSTEDSGQDRISLAVERLLVWQPIKTAPEDCKFLAFKPGAIGLFVGVILTMDHPDCQVDGGVHDSWSHQYVDGVTHWARLPAAPDSHVPAQAHPATHDTDSVCPGCNGRGEVNVGDPEIGNVYIDCEDCSHPPVQPMGDA